MAGNPSTQEVRKALLFMPDISGFTRFVNETEILHGQFIIQELLEILLDSNQLNLEVSEIEGDAIFFYRPGAKPSISDLLAQVESMYSNFHQRLKLYDKQKICHCGACQLATALKLKIIVHYGEISQYTVKEHRKLFGRDVIVIHRLLKNSVPDDEYLLMTAACLESEATISARPWFRPERGSESYDAGEVDYYFSALTELKEAVPAPRLPALELSSKAGIAFSDEDLIMAELGPVFNAVFDLEQRTAWMDGVRSIEILNHEKINRRGTRHRCVTDGRNAPIVVTESAKLSEDLIELVEMDATGMGGCRYRLANDRPGATKVKVEVLVKNNLVTRLLFNLLMKNKLRKQVRQSLLNLKRYCHRPVAVPGDLVSA